MKVKALVAGVCASVLFFSGLTLGARPGTPVVLAQTSSSSSQTPPPPVSVNDPIIFPPRV